MKRLFIPMTKYDAAKGIAYGVAASSTLDRANEIFDYAGSKPYFEKWSAAAIKATAGKSAGNLRSMHGQIAAGKIESLVFNDDDELIEVAAKVVDPTEQKKCEEGVYTGFSMGGKYIKKWKDPENSAAMRYIADPYELSLVDLPCIPDATFEYVKAEGVAPELRKFHVEVTEPKPPSNDAIALKARELAKAAGDETKWMDHAEAARKALTAEPGDLEPKHVAEIAVTAVDETAAKNADGSPDDLGATQQWTHPRLPGEGFEKKADLRAALAKLDATEAAAKLAAPVTDALKDLNKVLDAKDPAGVKKNASDNEDFAGKGKDKKPDPKDPKAEADAKAKQKAKDEADKSKPMKSAVDVIARAKAHLAAPVPSFVERREILKAATEFDAVAGLPAGFIDDAADDLRKVATEPELKKAASLYQVSSLISLVAQLESFHTGLGGNTGGGYYYGDGDRITVVECSPETMNRISTMCDELGAAAAAMLDEVLSAMKAGDAEKALGRGTVLADLHKIGARNSASDKTRLTKAHDLLAEIAPDMCGGTDKSAGDGDLAKVVTAQQEAFTKTLGDIGDVIKDVAERVKRIEAQPLPGRPSSVNLVEKGSVLEGIINSADANSADRANREAFATMRGEMSRLSAPAR